MTTLWESYQSTTQSLKLTRPKLIDTPESIGRLFNQLSLPRLKSSKCRNIPFVTNIKQWLHFVLSMPCCSGALRHSLYENQLLFLQELVMKFSEDYSWSDFSIRSVAWQIQQSLVICLDWLLSWSHGTLWATSSDLSRSSSQKGLCFLESRPTSCTIFSLTSWQIARFQFHWQQFSQSLLCS